MNFKDWTLKESTNATKSKASLIEENSKENAKINIRNRERKSQRYGPEFKYLWEDYTQSYSNRHYDLNEMNDIKYGWLDKI
jgi:predicted nucleotidyltransferase